MTQYVAGFLLNEKRDRVVVVRKNRPEWQAGRLNAVGGHIEEGETAAEAMRREFKEEAGLDVPDWHHFATVQGPWGAVYFYRAFGEVESVMRMEDEEILVFDIERLLQRDDYIPNLEWLLYLARYTHDIYWPVIATERG